MPDELTSLATFHPPSHFSRRETNVLKLVRQNVTAIAACLTFALGVGAIAHGDENFWTKPSNAPASNDSNTTNWAGTPVGEQPKPNAFKRATSAMGSAASSFSSGVKGIFAKKDKGGESADSVPAVDKPPAKKYDANFHVTLAQLQERTSNWAGAQEQYDKALKIDPDHMGALLGYGHLYDRQQKYSEALAWYMKAVKRHPNEAAAHNDLGLCYSQLNRMSDAVAELEIATNLQPTKKLYRNNLATLLVKMNRPDDAYQQLLAVHPPAVAHYNIGYLLTETNQRQLAYQFFCDALTDDPNLAEAREWRDLLAPSLASRPNTDVRPQEVAAIPPPNSTPAPVSASTAPERALPRAAMPQAVQPQQARFSPPAAPPVASPAVPARVETATSRAELSPPVAAATSQPSSKPQPALPGGEAARANDVSEAPLPGGDETSTTAAASIDRLAAPAPETIGTPSGSTASNQTPRQAPRRAQRSGYVAPSRY